MKRNWKGIVDWFKKEEGYGSILLDEENGIRVFAHFSSIADDPIKFPDGYKYLLKGQIVFFHLIENPDINNEQRFVAQNIAIISE
ncbi:cold shock domain-containing protein [Bacillus paramycoides]|uniref:cold shock domain-containing protein n=1 Tax=Bacillus paramycoides TaxID=2026194 RepID=UPI0015BD1730|nr:cold shock domain-containing protein [Bacillus paramycoides]NWK69857.1 cold shock domain-containing protein [Bacillus paramycoides]